MSHTPGPWNYMEARTLIHVETDASNPAGAGIPICSLPKSSKNADLIAAAPELFEALLGFLQVAPFEGDMRLMMISLAGLGLSKKDEDYCNLYGEAWTKARAAIHLARQSEIAAAAGRKQP